MIDQGALETLQLFLQLVEKYNGFVVIGAALFMMLSPRIKMIYAQGSPLNLVLRAQRDKQINDALDSLLGDLDCDRAYVFQYHNGNENICGIHFAKCTSTHERCQVGTKPLISRFQNVPNSLFATCNLALMKARELRAPNLDEFKRKDLSGYHALQGRCIKSFYLLGIFDLNGKPMGFVGMDYCREDRDLSDDEFQVFRSTALKICGLILSGDKDIKR